MGKNKKPNNRNVKPSTDKKAKSSDVDSKKQPHQRNESKLDQEKLNELVNEKDESNVNTNKKIVHDPKFSKRKIVSNWDRYDEEVGENTRTDKDEELTTAKSYKEIIQNKGGLSSHFQFKEEKSWLDGFDFINNKDGFLQLNLSQLASDISSFSIMEKLQLNQMDDNCQYCFDEMRYKEQPLHSSNKSNAMESDNESKDAKSSDVETEKMVIEDNCISTGVLQQANEISATDHDTLSISRDQDASDVTHKPACSSTQQNNENVVENDDVVNDASDVDELDLLLESNLELPASQSCVTRNNAKSQPTNDELEDWLDDLLS